MSCTIDENTFFNRSLDTLSHHGVMGMKWGVRNEETLRKYNGAKAGFTTKRKAKKDAKEFARAKVFWGEGAGIRRRQIKATVEQRSNDLPGYKEEFTKHLQKQDMKKHSSKANKERSSIDKSEKRKKNIQRFKQVSAAVITSAAGITLIYAQQNPEAVSDFINKARNIKI